MNPGGADLLSSKVVDDATAAFAADVRKGLTAKGQKCLPSKYLYDEVGSNLFEAICRLPEYGLTRADERILREHARDVADHVPPPVIVGELGSGSGRKTRWILEEIARRAPTRYYPLDISPVALAQCEGELGRLEGVEFHGLEGGYLEVLPQVVAERRPDESLLLLFLGSTIGNFDRPVGEDFLRAVREVLEAGDALLLGTDLEKPIERMLAAYDDSAGVTAAFNQNLLVRINEELNADFDLSRFRHEARFDAGERRVEMHLRSTADQTVQVGAAHLTVQLREGETIWTESSHKFAPDEPPRIARRTGFRCEMQWFDEEWPFAENLFRAV